MVHFLDQHLGIANRLVLELLDGYMAAIDQHILGQPHSPETAFAKRTDELILVIEWKS